MIFISHTHADLSYAQTQGVLFLSLVNLYKSMGGGWVVTAEGLTKEMAQDTPVEVQAPQQK